VRNGCTCGWWCREGLRWDGVGHVDIIQRSAGVAALLVWGYHAPARSASTVWRRGDERRKRCVAGNEAAVLQNIVGVRAGHFLLVNDSMGTSRRPSAVLQARLFHEFGDGCTCVRGLTSMRRKRSACWTGQRMKVR
jgi:hypothetical protein